MRLNAWLARAGVASRRGADELIKAGRVTVDGAPGQLNTFVGADADVRLDGEPLQKQRLAYVLLHKPAGVVTTARDPHGRPTVVGLVEHPARVVPVGRLDADTTGALLLTNDGDLAHRLAHPRYEIDKVYVADVEGEPTDATLRAARARRSSSTTGRTAPAAARRLGPSRVELTIHEGRKHQVKRMLAAVGHPGAAPAPQRLRPAHARRARSRATGASSSRDEVEALARGHRREAREPLEPDEPHPLVHRLERRRRRLARLVGADARAAGSARRDRCAARGTASGSARAARRPPRRRRP